MEWIIGISILAIFVAIGILLGSRANKKMGNGTNKSVNVDKINFKGQLSKNTPFISAKELRVYEIFESILPEEYVAFPKVSVEKLLKPNNGHLLIFNSIRDKMVDMVIFKKSNMEPAVVVDIFDTSIAERGLQELDKMLSKALSSVNLPILKIEVKDNYNKNDMLAQFLDKLNPVALAELRKNLDGEKKK